MNSFSRRSLLKNAALASVSIPFLKLGSTVEEWQRKYHDLPVGVSDSDDLVKLNSNENPYGPSEKAREALIEAITHGNRYPRNAINKLQKKIAEHEGLSPDQIIITAGSTELLGVAGLMAGLEKGNVIGCNPTFDFLLYFANKFGADWIKVPLTEDHQYNLAGINEKVNGDTRLIFVCNPNNPTGGELPKGVLQPFCETLSERCMVYLDEAYIEFSKDGLKSSLASLTATNKNIIVARTFSKIYGLAGLRVGYAIAHPHTISRMKEFLQGRAVSPSVCSLAAASASIGDDAFLDHCRDMNAKAREMVYQSFREWDVDYIPSSTSFIFFRKDRFGETHLVKELQRNNVLIREYSHVPGWARVSMGTLPEMKRFLETTQQYLA